MAATIPSTGALSTPAAPTVAVPGLPAAPLQTSQLMPWNTTQTVPDATPAQNNPEALSTAVNKVVEANNPIMQRAAAMANEQSNASGLLNSSMAVGSAENAVLNQALPIAQGDVGAQEQNTAAKNAVITQQLGQANQIQLSGINAQYNTVLNTNSNASTLYNNVMSQVGQIQNNPNMDAATKQTAIDNVMQQLQSGLSLYSGISGIDVGRGLQFSNPAKPIETAPPPAPAPAPTPTQFRWGGTPLQTGVGN